MLRREWRDWIMVAALLGVLPMSTAAQVTTERGASIIVFPKVIADGTWDTVIQIANEGDVALTLAHCFYVNGALTIPDQPPGPANPPQWAAVDFGIALTRLQPTHWVASRGRLDDPTDLACRPDGPADCDGTGFDPGRVPALPPGFRGELLCIETDQSGAPISGNHLIGVATLQHLAGGDVAKYNAIGARGRETNNSDNVLCLGGQPTAECPLGAEYDACPDTWILNHLADGSPDPLGEAGSAVTTSITVVPCAHDLENQTPRPVTFQFSSTNEFEQTFSASTTVTCWADMPLTSISPIFGRDTLGADLVQTRIRARSGGPGGFLVVAQTARAASGPASPATSSMVNLHVEGTQPAADLIILPMEQVQQEVVQ